MEQNNLYGILNIMKYVQQVDFNNIEVIVNTLD